MVKRMENAGIVVEDIDAAMESADRRPVVVFAMRLEDELRGTSRRKAS